MHEKDKSSIPFVSLEEHKLFRICDEKKYKVRSTVKKTVWQSGGDKYFDKRGLHTDISNPPPQKIQTVASFKETSNISVNNLWIN